MKTNLDLQKDVEQAINGVFSLYAADIVVTASDGIVTLTGIVDRFSKKIDAQEAAKKIGGIKSIVDQIEVKTGSWEQIKDNDIAEEVLKAFRQNINTHKDNIKIKVQNGWVTLTGELEWNYLKEFAKAVVSNLIGVIGVINNIKIHTDANVAVHKTTIERALKMHISLDAANIEVTVIGKNVILNGSVDSLHEKELAERIAWKAPGASIVDNQISVRH